MALFASQASPLYELVTSTDFAYSSTVKQNMKQALEEFQREVSSCLCAPCKGNGVPILKGTISGQLVSLVGAIMWRAGCGAGTCYQNHIPSRVVQGEFLGESLASALSPRVCHEALFIISMGGKRGPWTLEPLKPELLQPNSTLGPWACLGDNAAPVTDNSNKVGISIKWVS